MAKKKRPGRPSKRKKGVVDTQSAAPADTFLTPLQLAARWQTTVGSLANSRSRGEGLRFMRTPTGAIRYRFVDVLAAENDGERGFSWHALETALAEYPRIKPTEVVRIVEFLKEKMLWEARRR